MHSRRWTGYDSAGNNTAVPSSGSASAASSICRSGVKTSTEVASSILTLQLNAQFAEQKSRAERGMPDAQVLRVNAVFDDEIDERVDAFQTRFGLALRKGGVKEVGRLGGGAGGAFGGEPGC